MLLLLAAPAAAQTYDIDLTSGAVQPLASSPTHAPTVDCQPRASDPARFDLVRDSIVVHAGRRTIRERLRRDGEGLTWIFESDGALVVATQLARGPFGSDRVFAVDQRSGRILWRKPWRTTFAGNLGGGRLAVEMGTDVVVIEARTGREITRAPSTAGIGHVCRGATAGAAIDLVKTSRTLLAIDARTGVIAWQSPATWDAAPAIVGSHTVDVWMDTRRDRWGITVRRLADGALERTVEIGSIGALDIVRFGLIARGADQVTVDAMFAWE